MSPSPRRARRMKMHEWDELGKWSFSKRDALMGGCVSGENGHPGQCGQVALVTRQSLWGNLSAVLVNHVTEARGYLTPVCEH